MFIQTIKKRTIYKEAFIVGGIYGGLAGLIILMAFMAIIFFFEYFFLDRTFTLMDMLDLVTIIPLTLGIGGLIGVILGGIVGTIFCYSRSIQTTQAITSKIAILLAISCPLISFLPTLLENIVRVKEINFEFVVGIMIGIIFNIGLVMIFSFLGKSIAKWGYTKFFRRLGVTE